MGGQPRILICSLARCEYDVGNLVILLATISIVD